MTLKSLFSTSPSIRRKAFRRLRAPLIAVASALACLVARSASAQAAGTSANAIQPAVEIGPRITIGLSNAALIRHRGVNGHIRPTAVFPNEDVTVRLDYAHEFVGSPIVATPLDGGEVSLTRPNALVDQNGVGWIRFRAGREPGLYRVVILTGGNRSIVKFWVDDSKNPAGNLPAIHRRPRG
jgi:hypothetical protein